MKFMAEVKQAYAFFKYINVFKTDKKLKKLLDYSNDNTNFTKVDQMGFFYYNPSLQKYTTLKKNH